ncbi:MAG TPA: SPFH domain-containing protein [Beijerinckiaceae bacterium]|nr:SPFH domain-containing protein [Beijerinckiaceae bacterium]
MAPVAGFTLFAAALALFVLITLLMGIRQVPQGFAYTVERFGKYYKTLTPGLGLVMPWVDRIGRRMNVMEQVLDVPSQEVITKDNATVKVDGVVFFQVLDAARASYEVANLQVALLNLVMTNIRTVMGSMDLDQLLSHRDEINVRLLNVVDAAVSPWGIKTNRIEIKDIVPPRDLIEAMGRQMKAEREKRAVILEAEGQRQSEVLRAEGRKQALILDAEGRKEAAFRDSEARERLAAAEAKATDVVSQAISTGDVAALNYFIADKFVRGLTEIAKAPNQKVLILPTEMGALAATLGGIAQIARSVFGESGEGDTTRSRSATVPRAGSAPPSAS